MQLQQLIYILSGLAIVLALLLLVALLLRPNPKSDIAEPVTTVSSLADVSRRLELAGYSYVEEDDIAGHHFVTYEREAEGATFTATIDRWWGDQRLLTVAFSCRTNFATFDSVDARGKLCGQLHADVCAMINESDYSRAVLNTKEVEGPLTRVEGQATTADGWRIYVVEFLQRTKLGETVPMATVVLTNMETDEDIPLSAVLEYERRMEEATK